MELTIEQALQQGVAAHKEGKLQDAEHLYRAILQSQPAHPDANHNLGVLAVSVNKADAAFPLFKTALEANPKIEQFWLSYIDALIKEKQFENAKLVIKQAKSQGVAEEKLNVLETLLTPSVQVNEPKLDVQNKSLSLSQKRKKLSEQKKWKKKATKQNLKANNPSQQQLTILLEHYQNRRFNDAEKLAVSITNEFPKQQFGWKVLGAVLGATGRKSEAVDANQTAVALAPQDAAAHSNLGVTLKELGRLDEAVASYTQAIMLKSDYAEAHSNLGVTLKELGRLDEAEKSFTQAISLKPHYAEACYNLGNTLKKLGRLDEAEASYTKAIALKPGLADAHNNLGNTLQELGRLDEALASWRQAIALKPDLAEAMLNISITQRYMNNLEAEIVSLKNVLRIDSDDYGLKAGVNLAICNFLEGDFTESKKLLLAATKIQDKTSSAFKNERVYWIYLSDILKWHENKYIANKKEKNDKTLYVLGESHSLASHHLRIKYSEINFFCSARLIKGCKQWHLGNAFRNQYKHQFESIFFALPKHSYVLLAIGEIDCRLETGIIAHKKKFPEKQLKEIILTTVENYLIYIVNNNSDCQHKVIIQGVPCPNIDIRSRSQKDIKQLVEVIKIFNYELKVQSKEKGFKFLDTYQLTNKGDGLSTGSWHMDDYHLSPEGMQEAWRRFASEKSYEQY
jgi:tetratricopeptide (TPR) repeat protein